MMPGGNSILTPEILVPRLGDYLLEKGWISPEDLQKALRAQEHKREGGDQPLLGQILLEMGLIDRLTLDRAVTEQILQLRAALQEANQQLEQRVQERTAELQNALMKLSELNQLKSNIIANISHELRTPLTHIKGYIELLLTSALGELTEQQLNALQVVQRSSERLENQIEDLIYISMSARGEFTLRIVDLDLSTLFQAIFSRSISKAQDRNIDLLIDTPTNLPRVKADEEKLSWALLQLVDNAIKFTPTHGKVTLTAKQDQGLITVTVSDTGIGIPDDRVSEIFEPFHQLDGSATRRYGGTGLGLTLVRQIVEAHGSEIRVQSVVGEGTRFEFVLAVMEADHH